MLFKVKFQISFMDFSHVDWRPCGNFPWDTDDIAVDCNYTYTDVKQWYGYPTEPPLVLQGRCTVTCPVEAEILVGPLFYDNDGYYMMDEAYYCNVGNRTWTGSEPMCLGRYDVNYIITKTTGIRLVGGEFYGCVELYDNVTQQWGPVKGWDAGGRHHEARMSWADLACRSLGFREGLATAGYELTNGVVSDRYIHYLQGHYSYRLPTTTTSYPSSVPKFIVSQSLPQGEGATLHDAIDRVDRGSSYSYGDMCLACAGERQHNDPHDWRPCGDFPWDTDDVTVDCDYSYTDVKQWNGDPTEPPLVLQGRCTVTCPVEADMLVGPVYSSSPGYYVRDGAYYCNVGNRTWTGSEPVCLSHYDNTRVITNESTGTRLVGGEFYGCVELYDDVTGQWGPVKGWRGYREDRMSWANLACRDLGFREGLATWAYRLTNGVFNNSWALPLQEQYRPSYPSTVPKFIVSLSLPQWEGVTLHDAIDYVVQGPCRTWDWYCSNEYSTMCLACAGERLHNDPHNLRPCGDFPWDTDDVTVDCDYSYTDVKQWNDGYYGSPTDAPTEPLVLQGRCTVTCPVEGDMLVGPPVSEYPGYRVTDGAYYCNVGNHTWMGSEPVCLGRYDANYTAITDESNTTRLVGGEFYGCVELYDNITGQWGLVRGWHADREDRMAWADLACRNLGFREGLATNGYLLTNGVVSYNYTHYLQWQYHPSYPSTVPKFIVSQSLPQWEGATLHDAIDRVERGPCPSYDYDCSSGSRTMCLACAGEPQHDLHDISAHVTCTSDHLEVSFPRPPDNSVQPADVQLAAPPCRAQGNSTHLFIWAPLGECGTLRESTPVEMIYRNTLIIGASSHGSITWQPVTKVPLECRLPRNKTLSLDFRPHLKSVFRSGVQGRGDFRISMELFRTDAFWQPVTEYPVFVELQEMIHVQIQVNSSDTDLQVFTHTCVATPSDNPDDTTRNDVIIEGCPKLPTLQFYPSPSPDRRRFGFQAFAYTSGAPTVYLHCNVLLCKASDPNSRCAQGCQPPSGRRRREAKGEPEVYRLIQGPIVVGQDQNGFEVWHDDPIHRDPVTAFAIIGACVVLAAAIFVVGLLYKGRREGSQAGYRVLESQD
ncbi:uncharacterized protein LOC118419941 [Branchiostoma floridae]|uniref:Uncharacterized protein LOC118419941 n=1 Tax=Branchiostoma floridae TaxID=7739 RepID=A0A9J7LHS5_BRAFL|nr:uncharacterized protein LOC118419941 [Branchiostoma floridae]